MLPNIVSNKNNQERINVVNSFLGINKGLHIADSELEDMKNMTNDYYPTLATRKKRGIMGQLTNPLGICGGDRLVYVDDDVLYVDGDEVLTLESLGIERQIVRMNAYICVFPDGVIYNTVDGTTKYVENEVTVTSLTLTMAKLDGTALNTYTGDSEPQDKTVLWIDTSSDPVVMKMYAEDYSMWTSVGTTYVKLEATGIGEGFKDYDSVKVTGIPVKGYNDFDFNDTLVVFKADDDYLIVAGLIDKVYTLPEQGQTLEVKVKRELPKMDYICELNNRLWGCRYGDNNEGEFVNEIYASKLGDPTNWFNYVGLDSDSYAASCGSQGEFTGIAAYSGYVFFFKEDGFHKLYGTKPSNFQMIFRPCRGVAKGAAKSIAIVDEVMIFKSRDAVVAYDGSENTISEKLGIEPYYDGVAVGYRNKYYLSMRDVDYNYRLYVYDITKGTWCVEDDLNVKYMTYANNATYIVDDKNNLLCINNEAIYTTYFPNQIVDRRNVIIVDGEECDSFYNFPSEDLYPGNMVKGQLEDTLEWSFCTGDLGLDNPYKKYIKRFNIRMQQDANSCVKIEVEYDSSGLWEYVTEHYAERKKSYEIPIPVRRADHIKLRLSGWGEFRLFSIAKAVEGGSGEDE